MSTSGRPPSARLSARPRPVSTGGVRYVVRYRDPSGKSRKKFARTLAQARTLRAQLVTDVARGEWQPLKRVGFEEYAKRRISTYNGRTSGGIRSRRSSSTGVRSG